MSVRESREWRPLIFVAVLMCHIAVVLLVILAARSSLSTSILQRDPLVLVVLPPKADTPEPATVHPPKRPPSASRLRAARPSATGDDSESVPAAGQPPRIDWEKEAEQAAKDSAATAAKADAYRNLSALSPEQLRWVRQNHLEPAPPGMPWKYRRVEITKGGFPIIHINDHCVAIPLMMFFVFCQIGHIEPKGDLFDHMRDPHDP